MRRNAGWECRSVLTEPVTPELLPNKSEEALKGVTTERLKNRSFFSIPILCWASQTQKLHVSIYSAIRWIIPLLLCHALFQHNFLVCSNQLTQPNVATPREMSCQKLVVVFVAGREREIQKEVVVREAEKIYFTCASRDFLLPLTIGLPAGFRFQPFGLSKKPGGGWGSKE